MQCLIEKKLASLQIQLPQAVAPVASYVPYTLAGGLVFLSGQLPVKEGKFEAVGRVGADIGIEQAQGAARLCGINLLAQLRVACGGNLDRVKQCVRLGVFVRSAEGFSDQPKVANGVSDLIVAVFGEAGKHSRAAVGVNELPFGVAVEVDGVFELSPA